MYNFKIEVNKQMISVDKNTADVKWAIGINRIMLNILGLLADTNDTLRRKILSNLQTFIFVFLIFFWSIFPQVLALIKVWGNMTLMFDNMVISIPMSISGLKLIIAWHNKKGYKS